MNSGDGGKLMVVRRYRRQPPLDGEHGRMPQSSLPRMTKPESQPFNAATSISHNATTGGSEGVCHAMDGDAVARVIHPAAIYELEREGFVALGQVVKLFEKKLIECPLIVVGLNSPPHVSGCLDRYRPHGLDGRCIGLCCQS